MTMDVASELASTSGLTATADIKARLPKANVLILTATKALVADYLRRARLGEDRGGYDGLTDREREILHLIAQGKTTPEIAAELVLSPHTVQTHRDHIMGKLDLHSKAALIKYVIEKGLIEL